MVDISSWQAQHWGTLPPSGGCSPEPCSQCGQSTWIEIGGGPAEDVYHPSLDIAQFPGVDVVCDLEAGVLPFHDGHATKIKAIHSLQHLSRDGATRVIRDCYRILANEGTLFVMISDLDFIFERIREDGLVEEWANSIWHGPNDNDGFGYHRWGYNFKTMGMELMSAGFNVIKHAGYYNRWDLKIIAYKL